MELRELGLQAFDDLCRSIGRIILDNKGIKCRGKRENVSENVFDILFLVIGRYDDNSVVLNDIFYK